MEPPLPNLTPAVFWNKESNWDERTKGQTRFCCSAWDRRNSNQPVVIVMGADPEPDDFQAVHLSKRAVSATDPGGVDIICLVHFFEIQSRMRRISLKQAVRSLRA
jgi:hypothetical protein